jgi:hypothetical protein
LNYLDLLAASFAILALVAVYEMRPCTLILAGNNMLVARALSGLERAGQPASFWFLPGTLFGKENLAEAGNILGITLATMTLFTVAFIRKRVRMGMDAPAVPRWFLVAMVPYLIAVTASSTTILTDAYVSEESYRYDFDFGGAHALLVSLLLYELSRRRLLGQIGARWAFTAIFVVVVATGYAKGGTGLTTGYLVVSAVLLLPRAGSSRRLENVARVASVMLVIVALSSVVRGVRGTLADQGTPAVGEFLSRLSELEGSREETGEGAEGVANATQSAVQMLMCTDLYDSGNSRGWRSIYDLPEYTFKPSFFLRWFGWQRSVEPARELREHFVHGGGINVLGEFYWNGGYACVIVMVVALVLFCTVVDLRYRASPFWLVMATQFAPAFLMGYGYGLPQVARGAINGLLVVCAFAVLTALHGALSARMRAPVAPAGSS